MSKIKGRVRIGWGFRDIEIDANQEELVISETIYNYIDLSFVEKMRSLESVVIKKNPLDKIDLTPLSKVGGLQKLVLDRNQLREIDLTPLEGCDELKYLMISDESITTLDLTPLRRLQELEFLEVFDTKIIQLDLEPLQNGPSLSLTHLNLGRNKMKKVDLWPLASCEKLTNLALSEANLSDIDLSPLSKCNTLKNLGIGYNPIGELDLSPLSQCEYLEVLHICFCLLRHIELGPLKYCLNLKELYLANNSIQDVDLSPLSDCVALEVLDLEKNPIEKLDISPLFLIENLCKVRYEPEYELLALDSLKNKDVISVGLQELLESVRWIGIDEIPKLGKGNQIHMSKEVVERLDSIISQLERNWKIDNEMKEVISSLSETEDDIGRIPELLLSILNLLLSKDYNDRHHQEKIEKMLDELIKEQSLHPSLKEKISLAADSYGVIDAILFIVNLLTMTNVS